LKHQEQAVQWLEQAIELDDSSAPELQAALGSAYLEHLMAANEKIVMDSVSERERMQLDRCIEQLEAAWAQIKETELAQYRTEWLAILAIAYKLKGDIGSVEEHLDEAIKLNPDNPKLILRRALVHLEQDDYDNAITLLESIESNEEVPTAALALSDAYRAIDKQGSSLFCVGE